MAARKKPTATPTGPPADTLPSPVADETNEGALPITRGRPPGMLDLPEGSKAQDVRRIGMQLMYWYGKDKAVTDDEIIDRMDEYFNTCLTSGEIPTYEALSLALGYTRATLHRWETGAEGSTPTRRDLVKKAKELLASFDASLVMEGKLNPVSYIFRSKNYHGLKDTQEHVITPNNPLGDIQSEDELRKKLSDSVIIESDD